MTAKLITPGARQMLISVFFFSLMNIGVKLLPHIPASEIVLFRAFVSLVVCYVMVKRAGLSPWGNHKRYLILRGLSGTAALVMYFYTLQNMPLASAVTLIQLSPIFTIVIAGFMLGEPPRAVQWLFFLLSFAGVLLVKGFDPRVAVSDVLIGVTAAFLAGVAYNYVRKLKDHDHPLVVVFYFPLVTVPVVGTYSLTRWVQPQPLDWVILILIGLVTTAAQVFMTKAYQAEKAANVSNYNYLQVVLGIVVGLFIFNESISLLSMGGIVLIILGVLMGARYRRSYR